MNLIPRLRSGSLPTLREEFDSVLQPFFGQRIANRLPEAFQSGPVPAVNLAETEGAFQASIELPGMEEKDFEVELMGNQLRITGERKWESEKHEKDFYRVESQYGTFTRVIELPDGLRLDSDAVRATYRKGMLEIEIPKLEPRAATKIKVKTK